MVGGIIRPCSGRPKHDRAADSWRLSQNGRCRDVLAMQSKRYVHRPICFLTTVEIEALLTAPDLSSWSGRRDRALLLLAVQTGLRGSELTGLRCKDIVLDAGAHVQQRTKNPVRPTSQRHRRGAAQLAARTS